MKELRGEKYEGGNDIEGVNFLPMLDFPVIVSSLRVWSVD